MKRTFLVLMVFLFPLLALAEDTTLIPGFLALPATNLDVMSYYDVPTHSSYLGVATLALKVAGKYNVDVGIVGQSAGKPIILAGLGYELTNLNNSLISIVWNELKNVAMEANGGWDFNSNALSYGVSLVKRYNL